MIAYAVVSAFQRVASASQNPFNTYYRRTVLLLVTLVYSINHALTVQRQAYVCIYVINRRAICIFPKNANLTQHKPTNFCSFRFKSLMKLYGYRRGSHFGETIQPHLVLKWPLVDFESPTWNQNDSTRLNKKVTNCRLKVDLRFLISSSRYLFWQIFFVIVILHVIF